MKINRIIDYLVFILFVTFAFVQFNDADGWVWMIVYGLVALSALLYNNLPPILIRSMAFLFSLALLSFIPEIIHWAKDGFPSFTQNMDANNPQVELMREAGGLVISIITLFIYTKKADKK